MNPGQQILQQFDNAASIRQPLENYYRDAYRYTLPHRGMGFFNNASQPNADAALAKQLQARIFDSTAIDAVRLLSSSMVSGLVPANNQWFDLTIPNVPADQIEQDATIYLQQSATQLFTLIHAGNFNDTVLEHFEDMSIAGFGGIYITKPNGGAFQFELWSPDGLYIDDTLGTGKIDTVYRCLSLSAGQANARFGFKNLSNDMQALIRAGKDQNTKFQFIHMITPRMISGQQATGETSTTMPFQSMYVDKQSGKVVKESGYHEFPVVIPRWSAIPKTPYALGQINMVLPDIKTLNKIVEFNLQNNEMNIAGVFIAQQDGIINPKTFKLRARQVNFIGDVNQFKSISSPGNYNVAVAEIQRIQTQIRAGMMADVLSPIKKDYASATEVSARSAIIRQILSPVFARMTSEFLEPLITRTFNLAMRDGTLPPAPESLLHYNLIPIYTSPLARAAKMDEVHAMDKYEQAIAGLAQIFPGALDVYDFDAALLRRAALLGVPAELLRTKQQIADARKQQQQQQPPAGSQPPVPGGA